jgi:hypothetical protein
LCRIRKTALLMLMAPERIGTGALLAVVAALCAGFLARQGTTTEGGNKSLKLIKKHTAPKQKIQCYQPKNLNS